MKHYPATAPVVSAVYCLPDGRLAALLGMPPLPGTGARCQLTTDDGAQHFFDGNEPLRHLLDLRRPVPVGVALRAAARHAARYFTLRAIA